MRPSFFTKTSSRSTQLLFEAKCFSSYGFPKHQNQHYHATLSSLWSVSKRGYCSTSGSGATSFGDLLRAGMKEEADRRKADRFHLPVSRRGVVEAIGLGGEAAASQDDGPDERQERNQHATDHLRRCLEQLPASDFDCTRVYEDHVELSRRGWTLLHYAAFVGNLNACRLLLRYQSTFEAQVHSLTTTSFIKSARLSPLGLAILQSQYSVAKYLWARERGIDLNATGDKLYAHLVYAGASKECILWCWRLRPRRRRERKVLLACLVSSIKGVSIFNYFREQEPTMNFEELVETIFLKNTHYPSRVLRFLDGVETSMFPPVQLVRGLYSVLMGYFQFTSKTLSENTLPEVFSTIDCILTKVEQLGVSKEDFLAVKFSKTSSAGHPFDPLIASVRGVDRRGLVMTDTQLNALMKLLDFLLERGAIVNQVSVNGKNPLFNAVGRGLFRVTEFLLQRGANPNQVTFSGARPIDWTRNEGKFSRSKKNMQRLLVHYGADPKLCTPLPRGHEDRNAKDMRKFLDSVGMFRKVSPTANDHLVESTIVAQIFPGLTLHLGRCLTPKVFTPEDDHRLYLDAYKSLLAFGGYVHQEVRTVATSKFRNRWDAVNRTELDYFGQRAKESDGEFILAISSHSSDLAQASLSWKSKYDDEGEVEKIPLTLLAGDNNSRNMMRLSEDRLVLYSQWAMMKVISRAMQLHDAKIGKKYLDEVLADQAKMKALRKSSSLHSDFFFQ